MSNSDKVLEVTQEALDYLKDLLTKQEQDNLGIRVFVEQPGTPSAECCMAYCPIDAHDETDLEQKYEHFTLWIEQRSLPYLEDAKVDFMEDRLGGQLTFRAPKAKVPQLGAAASVEERINHVLYAEINPSLAAHGGVVSLIELADDGETAVLQFGGGCQGCAAVDMTLKQSVEKVLLEQIPELTKVTDITDHSNKENAYY